MKYWHAALLGGTVLVVLIGSAVFFQNLITVEVVNAVVQATQRGHEQGNSQSDLAKENNSIVPSLATTVKAQSSFDTNVYIYSETWLNANETSLHISKIAWPGLAGQTLTIFTNVSDILEYTFYDSYGELSEGTNLQFYSDRILVTLREDSLSYRIKSLYHPDNITNNGFIVIFDTTWNAFGYVAGDSVAYAKVDMDLIFWLPEDAALVSYAPGDAKISKEGRRYGVIWQFRDRAMDPYHDPLTYEITYIFDELFLKLADLKYQNLQEIQRLQNTQERTQNLSFALRFLALLGIILSLVAIFVAWLLTKLQFRQELKKARELPRTLIRDVEKENLPKMKIKNLMVAIFLWLILFSPSQLFLIHAEPGNTIQYHPYPVESGIPLLDPTLAANEIEQGSSNIALLEQQTWQEARLVENSRITSSCSSHVSQAESDRIIWEGEIDLSKDMNSVETVFITFPIAQERVYVWVNTSEVDQFSVFDASGNPMNYETEPDRFIITNVGTSFGYQIRRPYYVTNNSGILVYIDRFWLNYVNPNSNDPLDVYFNADITYRVILPVGAIVYSASPSELMKRDKTATGRNVIEYHDEDRAIDAEHDMFSMQVTYTFTDVLDAIEDQNALFDHLQVVQKEEEKLETQTLRDVILFSIISLIAPLIAFTVSYYIFRKRMLKQIKEEQQKYEQIVLAEEAQIEAAKATLAADPRDRATKAAKGAFFELLTRTSQIIGRSLFNQSKEEIIKFVLPSIPLLLQSDFVTLLEEGFGYSTLDNVSVSEALQYVKRVQSFLQKLERGL